MIIQLSEWTNWRISGSANDWQIQECRKCNDGVRWAGVKFYSALHYAIAEAYERTLRESPAAVDNRDGWMAECERVKKSLISAVKKASA